MQSRTTAALIERTTSTNRQVKALPEPASVLPGKARVLGGAEFRDSLDPSCDTELGLTIVDMEPNRAPTDL